MGRLWDNASRPFNLQRYKGEVIPDYVAQTMLGDVLTVTPTPSSIVSAGPDALGFPNVITPDKARQQLQTRALRSRRRPTRVNIDNGFWAQLMPRDQLAVDFTREVPFWWPNLSGGGIVTVFQKRVPRGRAWHLDNFYFFARSLGGAGAGSSVLLGPTALMDTILLRVFVSSSQLEYETVSSIVFGAPPQQVSFPFLNDRVGPREAKFGITLFGGEIIRAYIQARGPVITPPPYALLTIGFRCMGVEGAKNDLEDYLRWKRWDV